MMNTKLKKQLAKYKHGMLISGSYIEIIRGIGFGIVVAQFLLPFLPPLLLPFWAAPAITIPIVLAINFSQFYWDIDDKYQRMLKHIDSLDDPFFGVRELWEGIYNWQAESKIKLSQIRSMALDYHEGLEARFMKTNELLKELRKKNIGDKEKMCKLEKYMARFKKIEKEYFSRGKFRYGSGEVLNNGPLDIKNNPYKMVYREAYHSYKSVINFIKPLINAIMGGFFAMSVYNLLSSAVTIATITAAFPYATAMGITVLAISGWFIFQLSESAYQPRFKHLTREIKDSVNDNRERTPLLNWRFKQLLANKNLNEFRDELLADFEDSDRTKKEAATSSLEKFASRTIKPSTQTASAFWKKHRRVFSSGSILMCESDISQNKLEV